jgi:hypothetical protein
MQTTFQVYAAHDGRNHSHDVEGRSYEDAALAFVEEWRPAADAEGEVQIIVRDADSGREQCFRIDLFSGDAEPCG